MMPLGNRQFPARGQDAPRLCCPRPLDPGRPAGFIQDHLSAGRVSSVVRAAVACSWCLVVLFLLATGLVSRRGVGARRGTARGVWRVVAHDQSGWVALGRALLAFSSLFFFAKAKIGLGILVS